VRINGREWPPDPIQPTEPKPKKPQPPEALLFFVLVFGSPLAAWLAAWLGLTWARAIWPAGWLGALFVVVFAAITRQGRDDR